MPYFFWTLVPPAERDIATADDGMAADILLGFDKDYGTAGFACDDRGGQPCRPRADHDDIGRAVPVNRVLACRRAGYGSAQHPRQHPAPLPTMICPDRSAPSTAKIVAQTSEKGDAHSSSMRAATAAILHLSVRSGDVCRHA